MLKVVYIKLYVPFRRARKYLEKDCQYAAFVWQIIDLDETIISR